MAKAVVIYLALILGLLLPWLVSLARRGDITVESGPEPTVSSIVTIDRRRRSAARCRGSPSTASRCSRSPSTRYRAATCPSSRGEAVADRVRVESVPANEGFWLGERRRTGSGCNWSTLRSSRRTRSSLATSCRSSVAWWRRPRTSPRRSG